MISIVIPAHNEQDYLPATLTSVHVAADALASCAAGADYEVIVADDGSTDRTAAVAAEHGARIVRTEARQIAAARNAGARAAHGDVLLFIDADTHATFELLHAAWRALDADAIGGGARVRFDAPWTVRLRMATWTWNVASRVNRWAAGCFLFARREAFDAVGGFNETLFAAEEIDLSRRLQRVGPFTILPQEVLTSARKHSSHVIHTHMALLRRMATSGGRVLQDREGLDLWYRPSRG